MANPDFTAMFKTYACRNAELAATARQAYEFGKTIAKEPSSALSAGMDEHAIRRQKQYIEYCKGLVESLHAKPEPDLPVSHPTGFPVNLSVPYDTFVEDINGDKVPLNEQTALIAQYWLIIAVELAGSQSSSRAGGLNDHDYARALNNIGTLEKLVTEMTSRPILDLPETALPGAELGASGGKK